MNKQPPAETDKAFRNKIIAKIRRGEPLPFDYSYFLFPPERRECDLNYEGKMPREKILANTNPAPLQKISQYGGGGEDGDSANKLIFGDNLHTMRALLCMKKDGDLRNADGTRGIKLVYIDPPFASAQEFKTKDGSPAYQDKMETIKYLEFMRQRLILIHELLSDDGSIYVHLDHHMNSYVRILMDEIFGKENFVNEIIWRCTTGVSGFKTQANHWVRNHDCIFYYAKDKNKKYYKKAYRPHKEKNLMRKDRAPNPKGTRIDDCWIDIGSMQQNASSLDKMDYPTQKPAELVERIIQASSKEGDIVADFFAGSGTTCAAASNLNRKWICVDSGKLSLYKTQQRLLNSKGELQYRDSSFAVYNSGLYDASFLCKMSPEQWRKFSLQVFKCEDEPHEIGKIKMDGYKNGSSVIVLGQEDTARVTEDYIKNDLHGRIGKKVGGGGDVYIIAPWSRFGFMQDWIETGKVRYHALRIPCLNEPNFSPLSQPASQSEINQIVQSAEFSFIHRPEVEFSSEIKGGNGYVRLTKFQDMENRGGASKKFASFAMLMVDRDYKPSSGNEKASAFRIDEVFFADEMSKKNWTASFSASKIGDYLMLIFVDKYGNEARELISKSKFIRG